MTKTLPKGTHKPEAKVTAASAVTYLGSVAALAVVEAASTVDFAAVLPPGLPQIVLLPLIPAALAAAAGWFAPHTRRSGD